MKKKKIFFKKHTFAILVTYDFDVSLKPLHMQ